MLFERHHAGLYRFCRRMTGADEAAEDLVQEIFLRILRYRDTFEPGSDFRAWVFRLARNACNDWFRTRGRRPEAPLAEEAADGRPAPDAGPDDALAATRDRDLLRRSLALLSEDHRAVLLLSRFECRKYKEIAVLLDCSVAAVKVRVHRAVKQLRKHYGELRAEVTG